ncbi:MAG: glycoside hydrolase family 2 TIM barrel-domain containing protein [Anaerolineae bacterium]
MTQQPFKLGVNYWPRRKAMGWWSNFDRGEVREEFAIIRELNLSLMRIFLLWDDFQPEAASVSHARLDELTTVCDAAADNGLQLDVTFFTGHMSGPNWAPRWLLSGGPKQVPSPHVRQVVSGGRVVKSGYRNPFIDPVALNAERLLLKTVVGALKSHPAIGLWNLGNEPDLFAWPPNASIGHGWVKEMTDLIRSIDEAHPITCGLHIASLLENNGLLAHQVFAETDFAVMHAYPMYLEWSRSPLDADVVPFTCALTSALSGKPTLMEEFGGCTTPNGGPSETWAWTAFGQPRTQFMANEDEFAQYIAAVLPKLVEVGATGALLWCFADYDEALWNQPPCDEARHERHFGLIRPDGSIKPHAKIMRDFAATQPIVKAATRSIDLPMSPAEFYRDPARNTVKLYREYIEKN